MSDEVSLLIFKDNLPARALRMPLRWMTQFGLLLGALVLVSASSLYFAVRYYREARRGDPARVFELETELADVKAAYAELKSGAPAIAPAAPVVPVEVIPAPSQPAPSPMASEQAPPADWWAKLVPNSIPAGEAVSIRLQQKKAWVSGSQIHVRGAFQYTRTDNAVQTGRFLIVAKGAGETLWVHPPTAWSPPDPVLKLALGESFSVGRFREIRADFGNVANRKAVEKIQILVFDREGRQLISEDIALSNPPPKPAVSSASSPTQEEVTNAP